MTPQECLEALCAMTSAERFGALAWIGANVPAVFEAAAERRARPTEDVPVFWHIRVPPDRASSVPPCQERASEPPCQDRATGACQERAT